MDLGSPCPWTSGHNERWDILDFGFGQLIGPRQLKVWHLGIFRFAFGPFRKPGSTLVPKETALWYLGNNKSIAPVWYEK